MADAKEFLAALHFEIIFPVVWHKAATTCPSRVVQEPSGVEIAADSRFPVRF